MLGPVREPLVARGPDVHHLGAAKLEQDVVLGIEMIGGDRARRRNEEEALRRQHRAGARFDHRLQLAEQAEQQVAIRSEEHTSELQSLMRISYAVFCLKKKKHDTNKNKLKNKIPITETVTLQ